MARLRRAEPSQDRGDRARAKAQDGLQRHPNRQFGVQKRTVFDKLPAEPIDEDENMKSAGTEGSRRRSVNSKGRGAHSLAHGIDRTRCGPRPFAMASGRSFQSFAASLNLGLSGRSSGIEAPGASQ